MCAKQKCKRSKKRRRPSKIKVEESTSFTLQKINHFCFMREFTIQAL